jgi:hypothetical protein
MSVNSQALDSPGTSGDATEKNPSSDRLYERPQLSDPTLAKRGTAFSLFDLQFSM